MIGYGNEGKRKDRGCEVKDKGKGGSCFEDLVVGVSRASNSTMNNTNVKLLLQCTHNTINLLFSKTGGTSSSSSK